ncbi:PREDICTED: very long-chain acyl-CoA synthetase-like [Branchiostoma belcheri]|uniref:long-chain-fatty-acid--CoA ligase n=1 Tax=Branchiostoma belcheri TaxID=7741 RepID=A0A6P4YFZ0_BRABE|nr:PREDICTED: very long-chain acyl-CoA synthetase-like [Branchiostoma belcheri]
MGWETVLYSVLAGVVTAPILIKLFYPHFYTDVRFILKSLPITRLEKNIKNNVSVITRFIQQAAAKPDRTFLMYQDEVYTYREMDQWSNRVGNFFHARGLRAGETFAIFMLNEPAYLAIFLGLSKLGMTTAMLNNNLRSKSLLHCFNVSGAKNLIVGKDEALISAILEILPELQQQGVTVWVMGDQVQENGVLPLEDKIEAASDAPIPAELRSGIRMKDMIAYIYTSGTTGLPKAAKISYGRMVYASMFLALCGVTAEDVVYTALPLYHSAALCIGLAGTVETGCTWVLRKKFSASRFWDDCRKYNVTVVQYIGELLRYLCAQPKRPDDLDNQVWAAVGNGLRPEIWSEFQERFGVSNIMEFYAATEGNVGFVNLLQKFGAVGYASPLMRKLRPCNFVKYDVATGEPIRDENGWCIETKPGENGLVIAPITQRTFFDGYAGKKELSEKKVLRDVFKKGDGYFNSGDVLFMDTDYHVFFVDRLGDTFRWKGENVATTEVSQVLSEHDAIQEANVYGVKIPGYDGRAGMASLIVRPDHSLDFPALYEHVAQYLPSYAAPRFLRLQQEIDVTGTFKQKKVTAVEEGFDPHQVSDPLYFMDTSRKTYIPLDTGLYQGIVNGQVTVN